MACDLIVAAEDARLGEPEIRFGSAPVTLLMPFVIGQKKTRELLLTGDLIDAREAERIGLVNRVVPADRLAAEVDALADRLARVDARRHGPDEADAEPGDGRGGVRARPSRWASTSSRSSTCSETSRAFDEIVRRDGLKAALAWRDAPLRRAAAGRRPARGTARGGRPRLTSRRRCGQVATRSGARTGVPRTAPHRTGHDEGTAAAGPPGRYLPAPRSRLISRERRHPFGPRESPCPHRRRSANPSWAGGSSRRLPASRRRDFEAHGSHEHRAPDRASPQAPSRNHRAAFGARRSSPSARARSRSPSSPTPTRRPGRSRPARSTSTRARPSSRPSPG